MHTMWKGSISFGLVNVPIKMYAATENKDVTFRYLHKECHTPIKYVRMCPNCNREVEWDEIVKGYEYQPGQYILFEEEELKELAPGKEKTINIVEFVDLKEIDPIFFDKSYYLVSDETGNKAYSLLRNAMRETGKIAVARMTLRTKQNLCVIRCYENVLVLESIFYPDEVRSTALLPQLPEVSIEEKEMQMATQLIEQLSVPFDPTKYTDDYRNRLLEAIEAKVQGQEIEVTPEPAQGRVVDLMKVLQESLQQTRGRKPEDQSQWQKAVGDEQEGKQPRRRRRRANT
jgi:DNA end-binding protein Ku